MKDILEVFEMRTEISEVKAMTEVKIMISEKKMTETATMLKIKTTTVCEIRIFIRLIETIIVFVTKTFKFSENWKNKKKNVWIFS